MQYAPTHGNLETLPAKETNSEFLPSRSSPAPHEETYLNFQQGFVPESYYSSPVIQGQRFDYNRQQLSRQSSDGFGIVSSIGAKGNEEFDSSVTSDTVEIPPISMKVLLDYCFAFRNK